MDKWSLIFGVTIWKLCKWQNGRNSQGKNCAGTVVMEILSFVNDTVKSKTLKSSVMPDRDESMVAWQKPVGSWLKIKTGEAYKGSPGVAGAVVRQGMLVDVFVWIHGKTWYLRSF